jgi:hypothetical protein
MPDSQISFQRNGTELCRLHFSADQNRPFVFPINGPAGRSLTRMGHPHDPESHSHHNSVWISHNDVNGISFWDDGGKGRILHRRVVSLEDGNDEAGVLTESTWVAETNRVLLSERRLTTVRTLSGDEWLLIIDLELAAPGSEVRLGKTPFGMIGVRLAKSIGVNDGGGRILNSEGGINEAGCFWKPAKWVDYTGRITPGAIEGVILFDHPQNLNHPATFHTRDDGWMGASLSFNAPVAIRPGEPLRLRYGLYVHKGQPAAESLEERWHDFSRLPLPSLVPVKK